MPEAVVDLSAELADFAGHTAGIAERIAERTAERTAADIAVGIEHIAGDTDYLV